MLNKLLGCRYGAYALLYANQVSNLVIISSNSMKICSHDQLVHYYIEPYIEQISEINCITKKHWGDTLYYI